MDFDSIAGYRNGFPAYCVSSTSGGRPGYGNLGFWML